MGLAACSARQEEEMKGATASRVAIPPIDRMAPARTETATFALG